MKDKIRNLYNIASEYLELAVSFIVIIAIIISFIGLFDNIVYFFNNRGNTALFNDVLGGIMDVVIGIEFLKMLIKHNLSSIVEVLLFAISRTMIVGHSSIMEFLIGIIAICLLLVARKYLVISGLDDKKQN